MRIEIINRYLAKTCVIGKFQVYEGEELVWSAFALQEDKAGFDRGQDLRLPAGEYRLRRHPGSRFEKRLREITGDKRAEMICAYNDLVPYDRYILIHWGNTDRDTHGCILLGKTKANDNESIGSSVSACKEFYDLLNGVNLNDVILTIKDELVK